MPHHFLDFPLPGRRLCAGDDTMPGNIVTIQRDSPLTRSRFAVRECSEFNTHSASIPREPGINTPVIDTNNTAADTHDTKPAAVPMAPDALAYLAGRAAGKARKEPSENPHPKGLFIDTALYDAWALGWKDGRDARARRNSKRRHAFNRC